MLLNMTFVQFKTICNQEKGELASMLLVRANRLSPTMMVCQLTTTAFGALLGVETHHTST
jgi:hypothetical protein